MQKRFRQPNPIPGLMPMRRHAYLYSKPPLAGGCVSSRASEGVRGKLRGEGRGEIGRLRRLSLGPKSEVRIGLAIAERLGLEGAAVVICSRNKKNVDDAVQYLKSKGVSKVDGLAVHVANVEHQQNLINYTIAKYSKIDILINNHGINPAFGHILDVEDSIWDKLFEVNVKAGWQLTKLVHPHMVKNGGGNIVFNASIGGYKSPPGIAAYGVTKTALLGLTKALANGLAKDNIRVNAIAPGVIKTKMSEALWSGGGDQGEKDVVDAMEVPLSRLGTSNDCAGAVAFLVSDDAQYITGETILIAGGVHARL